MQSVKIKRDSKMGRSLPYTDQESTCNVDLHEKFYLRSRGKRYVPILPRMILLAIIGAFLSAPIAALTCDAKCATCFGTLST